MLEDMPDVDLSVSGLTKCVRPPLYTHLDLFSHLNNTRAWLHIWPPLTPFRLKKCLCCFSRGDLIAFYGHNGRFSTSRFTYMIMVNIDVTVITNNNIN